MIKDVEQVIYLKKILSHLLTFIHAAIAKVSDAKDKDLKVIATYHTKIINKLLKAKIKECVQKLEAIEKRKTTENTILIAGHKDEMSKLVKSYKKELHVGTIFLCVPFARIGFLFCLSNFNSLHKLCLM